MHQGGCPAEFTRQFPLTTYAPNTLIVSVHDSTRLSKAIGNLVHTIHKLLQRLARLVAGMNGAPDNPERKRFLAPTNRLAHGFVLFIPVALQSMTTATTTTTTEKGKGV